VTTPSHVAFAEYVSVAVLKLPRLSVVKRMGIRVLLVYLHVGSVETVLESSGLARAVGSLGHSPVSRVLCL
jgi:hypothetical protein